MVPRETVSFVFPRVLMTRESRTTDESPGPRTGPRAGPRTRPRTGPRTGSRTGLRTRPWIGSRKKSQNSKFNTENSKLILLSKLHYNIASRAAQSNSVYVSVLKLTNRFHVAVRLFSNRSQMTCVS